MSDAIRDLPVLVVGSGSIGRRHARNLVALGAARVAICDTDAERFGELASELRLTSFTVVEEALRSFAPAAVFVCTPPVFHIAQARAALEAGAHVFIEKPLSHSSEGIRELAALAQHKRRVVQVGYNLRFHPAIRQLKAIVDEKGIGRVLWAQVEVAQYLPDWRPWQDYRKSYTARADLGGGIILDASHELDYITWMLGDVEDVTCMAGKVSSLEVDVEDCATVLLRFKNGAQADVHLDFVQRVPARRCKLAGELGTAVWDEAANRVDVAWPEGKPPESHDCSGDDNQPYIDEVKHFFHCIEKGEKPLNDLESAEKAVRLIERAKAAGQLRQ